VRKISPPPGFDPRTVQLVASRYTDWAIAAHLKMEIERYFKAYYQRTKLNDVKSEDHIGAIQPWKPENICNNQLSDIV
jgi:hypothetical protein